jgi:hypothetical protein
MLWIGLTFAMSSMQMKTVAKSWLAYDISDSGLALGMVALARAIPAPVLALVGGIAAD